MSKKVRKPKVGRMKDDIFSNLAFFDFYWKSLYPWNVEFIGQLPIGLFRLPRRDEPVAVVVELVEDLRQLVLAYVRLLLFDRRHGCLQWRDNEKLLLGLSINDVTQLQIIYDPLLHFSIKAYKIFDPFLP